MTEERGYTSRNAECVEMRFDCGFTVDGELVSSESGRVVTITADECLQFVRA